MAGRSHCASSSRGFTLLEVLLAFVLLAAAMGLLVAMLSNGLRQVRQAQGETEASLYAQSLLDEVGRLEAIQPGKRQGEFAQGRYRYELEISEAEDPMPPAETAAPAVPITTVGAPKLYRVALAVSWGTGQPAQRLRLVTLRARTPPLTGLPQ
jgi:general secretion pathway protein I